MGLKRKKLFVSTLYRTDVRGVRALARPTILSHLVYLFVRAVLAKELCRMERRC